MNKIKIHFTAVFRNNDDFVISNNVLINPNDSRYEDAEVVANVVSEKETCAVTFEATGYFSDCALATRIFLVNLINAVYVDDFHTYAIIHDFLYTFIKIMNDELQYQSIHKVLRDNINAYAGLEIESIDDVRMSNIVLVLEKNDHYGNMFRRCPNCKDFEIPESKTLGEHIKRCPCCGLNLTKWE